MILDIKSVGFEMTAALEAHIVRRISQALETSLSSASRVAVRVLDLNGPRGGVDMECRIVVNLHGKAPIVVSERDEDLYVAITCAATMASSRADRALSRATSKRKRVSHATAGQGDQVDGGSPAS